MNPFLFIVGCARSGTTLLQRIIDAHPLVTIPPETHWIPLFFKKRIGLTPEGNVTDEFIHRLWEYPRFQGMKIDMTELEKLFGENKQIQYADLVSKIFDLYGKKQKKSLVGDKTPPYVRNIDRLHSLFPEAKFIHLIRDGRDVCLSALSWNHFERTMSFLTECWRENPVAAIALWWKRNVRLGRQQGAALGAGLYYEMHYEALVKNPTEECRKLCDFIGVQYDDSMVRFHEGKTKTDSGLSSKEAWLPITGGLRDWTSQLSPEDIELFEATSGDLLAELGYPRAFIHPSPEKLKHAAGIYESFTADLQSRRHRFPSEW